MPRISPQEQHSAQNVDVKKMFRERLIDRFGASDFVRVINPDTEPFTWSYLPSKDESLEMSNDGMHRFAIRNEAEFYQLNPGESEVIVGENAYIMIEALFKKLVAKKVVDKGGEFKPGMAARNFNFSDALAQEQLIDEIYLGKETPTFTFNKEEVNDTPAKGTSPARPSGKAA